MKGQTNPKIVGAAIIGFALVAGAYTVTNFGEPRTQQQAAVHTTTPSPRISIEVTDNDGNGIEDWRDEFVTASPVVLNQNVEDYVPPDTLTGKMSIDFMENIIRSKGYGPFGSTNEEIIQKTVTNLEGETAQILYGTRDITIMKEWDDQDIINYANTVAVTLELHNVTNLEGETVILKDLLSAGDYERFSELQAITNAYKAYRDDTLKLPVPAILAKEHLDLINTYNAIHIDVQAMTGILEDPAITLLRLRRYQDDATALGYALQNMFFALENTDASFSEGDPAVFFSVFSPDYQI